MSAAIGRALIVKRASVKIAAIVSKTVSINNEPVDITNDDDSGFRTLLEASGTRSIDISFEGVSTDDVLLSVAAGAAPTLITADEIEFPSGLTITGSFRFNTYEVSGEVAGRVQFSGTLQSSGAWVVTP
jgi:predicted secreted protein